MITILSDMPPHQNTLEKLKNRDGIEFRSTPPSEEARELPEELLREVQILFCTVPPSNIEAMHDLKFVQISSVGFTQVVGQGLAERNVTVCNARGVFDPTIAEWNLAMMINLLRDLRAMIRHQDKGAWDRDARFQRELRGLTLGIWGYGGIGRATARLAKAFGMQVKVLSRSGAGPREGVYLIPGSGDPQGELPDEIFTAGQEEKFLAELDFLVLAMPQNKHTEGIVGQRELRALPATAYVLNPARGPLIEEQALLHALREGWIAGAALDTHYHYPMPPDHPLWNFSNVIMTPHISGSDGSPYYLKRVWDVFAQNVERLQKGEPMLNRIPASQLS